jgi:hypothetical protein
MFSNDLLVDLDLTNYELVAAISQIFSVSPADILVVDDITEVEVSKHIRLVCERMLVQGDFSMRLCIYLHDSKLKQLDSKLTIKQFCGILHCQCLISDSSVNPYTRLLVRESGKIQPVALDPERLNENEEYIIIE